MPPGLILGAVPPREDFRDAWVCPSGHSLSTLPPGSKVGTSSLRRRAQLLKLRPDLQVIDLRGNVDTRLRKVKQGYQGLSAAILRCSWTQEIGLRRANYRILGSWTLCSCHCSRRLGHSNSLWLMPCPMPWSKKIHHPETWSLVQSLNGSLVKNIFCKAVMVASSGGFGLSSSEKTILRSCEDWFQKTVRDVHRCFAVPRGGDSPLGI